MTTLRAFFLRHRATALAVIALALMMKALVPAGFMLDSGSRVLSVRLCEDSIGRVDHQVALTIKTIKTTAPTGKHVAAHDVCPFSSLAHASLGGADPVQLALALLFILALGLAPRTPLRLPRVLRLQPPAQAPPLPA